MRVTISGDRRTNHFTKTKQRHSWDTKVTALSHHVWLSVLFLMITSNTLIWLVPQAPQVNLTPPRMVTNDGPSPQLFLSPSSPWSPFQDIPTPGARSTLGKEKINPSSALYPGAQQGRNRVCSRLHTTDIHRLPNGITGQFRYTQHQRQIVLEHVAEVDHLICTQRDDDPGGDGRRKTLKRRT